MSASSLSPKCTKDSSRGKRKKPRKSVPPQSLAKIFNTTLVTSQTKENKQLAPALFAISETSAFRSILQAVTQHALIHGISEKEASLEIIRTFRELDQLWQQYILEEGLAKMIEKGLKK
jgi:hypothetical protein